MRAGSGRILTSTIALALGACAEQRVVEPEEPRWEILGDTHVAPPGTGPPDTRPPLQPPPAIVHALDRSVEELRASSAPDPDDLGRALEQLAGALVFVVPERDVEIERIRAAADQVARSPRLSPQDAGATRSALEAAVLALSSLEPDHPARSWRLQRNIELALRAVLAIDPGVALRSQPRRLVEALDAVADTVRVAYGSATPRELARR